MCTEFPLGGKTGLGTQRQGAQRLEEHWQLARAAQYVTGR